MTPILCGLFRTRRPPSGWRIDAPDGAVVARLSVDGAEFWVADESPEHKNFSPESLGGGTVRMVMIVDEPDQVFAKAVAAGARSFGRWETNMGIIAGAKPVRCFSRLD